MWLDCLEILFYLFSIPKIYTHVGVCIMTVCLCVYCPIVHTDIQGYVNKQQADSLSIFCYVFYYFTILFNYVVFLFLFIEKACNTSTC